MGWVKATSAAALLVGSLLTASAGFASAATTEIRFGMELGAVDEQTRDGARPDFASFWVGPWSYSNWGGVDSQVRSAVSKGATPIIYWYYWGDAISPSCVENGCSWGSDWRNKAEWNDGARRLADALRNNGGGKEALVIIENEFNKGGIDSSSYAPTFDRYMKAQADVFHAVPGVKVLIGFGNWGQANWGRFPLTIEAADYMGVQTMRGSTRDSESSYLGAADALLSAVTTLKTKFSKDVICYDLALSSYPESTWLSKQDQALANVFAKMPELRQAGLVGLVYRSLRDTPSMSLDNYFGMAERYWGLKSADGTAKPALKTWIDGVAAARSGSTLPPPPPPPPPATKEVPGAIEGESFATKTKGGSYGDNAASGGAGWNLWANGAMTDTILAAEGGEYVFEVVARGDAAAGVWPHMTLSVGGTLVHEWDVASASYAAYTATASLAPGSPTAVAIGFTNDAVVNGQDRNLRVDVLRIATPAPPPPPPPTNNAPTAAFTSSVALRNVLLDASASLDPDGDALTYAWTFGDGSAGTGAIATHTYVAPGDYSVTLSVSDGRGGSASASRTVTVANTAPVASAKASMNGRTATLDATASSDAEGDALAYAWDFGDGTFGSGAVAAHAYVPGTYIARVTVADAFGAAATASVAVTAANGAPSPQMTTSASGLTLTADATATTDPDGDEVSYAWDFGDGNAAAGARTTHAYAAAGTYTVTLTASDGFATATATRAVQVSAPTPSYFPASLEAEAFQAKTIGAQVSDGTASADLAWLLWSNGAIKNPITVGTTGKMTLSIVARGNYVAGAWTLMEVRLDGATVATIRVDSASWRTYTATLDLAKDASRELSIAFTNDYYAGSSADRNLWIDRVALGAAPPPPATVTYEGETAAIRTVGGRSSDASASGGAAWNLWGNGYVESTLTLPSAGAWRIEAILRSSLAANVPAHAVLSIDGAKVAEWDTTTGWRSYGATANLAAGSHKFRIAFTNDAIVNGADRNLYVDVVRASLS